jgi:murein DD-endopeptidase MepM/ murein hydrolase activator NlpD
MEQRPWYRSLSLVVLFASAATLQAQPAAALVLELPVACRLNEECWVVNHVDLDTSADRQDYRCGAMTYDNHRGTDIGIVHGGLDSLRGDTSVLAAAPGVVRGTRDGMPDTRIGSNAAGSLKGRECGNGVVVAHEGGWTTQYCHLQRGSVAVRTGERVIAGQKLGRIGMSGMAAFPHVHFQVARSAGIVDPFSGPTTQTQPPKRCAAAADALWTPGALSMLGYPAGRVVSSMWLQDPPPDDPVTGRTSELTTWQENTAVHFRAIFLGVSPGDRLVVRVTDAAGKTVAENSRVAERSQIRVSLWLRVPASARATGTLTGDASIASGTTAHRSAPALLRRAAAR